MNIIYKEKTTPSAVFKHLIRKTKSNVYLLRTEVWSVYQIFLATDAIKFEN